MMTTWPLYFRHLDLTSGLQISGNLSRLFIVIGFEDLAFKTVDRVRRRQRSFSPSRSGAETVGWVAESIEQIVLRAWQLCPTRFYIPDFLHLNIG